MDGKVGIKKIAEDRYYKRNCKKTQMQKAADRGTEKIIWINNGKERWDWQI